MDLSIKVKAFKSLATVKATGVKQFLFSSSRQDQLKHMVISPSKGILNFVNLIAEEETYACDSYFILY